MENSAFHIQHSPFRRRHRHNWITKGFGRWRRALMCTMPDWFMRQRTNRQTCDCGQVRHVLETSFL
jgi:hypothetical protein